MTWEQYTKFINSDRFQKVANTRVFSFILMLVLFVILAGWNVIDVVVYATAYLRRKLSV